MPVNAREFQAKASVDMATARGAGFFQDLVPAMLATYDVSAAGDRWNFHQEVQALALGQVITWTVGAVPRDEFHIYHFLGVNFAEGGNKVVQLDLISPAPVTGAGYTYYRKNSNGQFGFNILGDDPGATGVSDRAYGRPLHVPPGFLVQIQTVSAAIGGTDVFLSYLRRVTKAPFETSPVTDVTNVIA